MPGHDALKRRAFVSSAALAFSLSLVACDSGFDRPAVANTPPPGPDAPAQVTLRYYGCGDCHTIPGVSGARGRVGPTLENFSERSIIAGSYPNTADNLVRFIIAPPAMRPGSAMPITGITEPEARTVAAYLLEPRRGSR
jgi:cytochrome c